MAFIENKNSLLVYFRRTLLKVIRDFDDQIRSHGYYLKKPTKVIAPFESTTKMFVPTAFDLLTTIWLHDLAYLR